MLVDKEIKQLMKDNILRNADEGNVGPISCDLVCIDFYNSEQQSSSYTLNPMESVFIGVKEELYLPNDLSAQITLKNSRIRQGLSLDAPIYFPGHHTRIFFRVTNVSNSIIELHEEDKVAQVVFEKCSMVEEPYNGTFNHELDFKNLASYKDIYSDQMKEIDSKTSTFKDMEKRVYGNILTLLGIFVGVFSLVNLNVSIASVQPAKTILVFDLTILGSLSIFSSLLWVIVHRNTDCKEFKAMVILGLLLILIAICIACCLA